MVSADKLAKIKILKYIVSSRWFLHLGILLLGLIQKLLGVAQFNPKTFLLLAFTYGYNFLYFLYLRQKPNKITRRGLFIISLLQVIVDLFVYTVVIYFTGGIESLSFLFYFLAIFMAIILFNEIGIILLTLLAAVFYVALIALEYIEVLPHRWRYATDPGFYQDIAATTHNTATVVLIIIFTAFLAGFIGRIIRSREEALIAETNKVNITLNNLIDAVIVLDPEGRIILLNPQAANILKIAKTKKVLNHKIHPDLFASNLQKLIHYIQELFFHKTNASEEIVIEEEALGKITLKVHGIALFDHIGGIKGYLIIIQNITREKELDRLKSDFISIAAHQLRTPLATIKWLFKMLLEGDVGELKDEQKSLLTKGFKRNNEVIEIVNNLLDVSEIEDGTLKFKKVKTTLEKIVEQIYTNSRDNAIHHGVKLVYEKPSCPWPEMFLDIQKIRISLQNLVDNAIKYTPSGGRVIFECSVKDGYFIVQVTDTGIGIPPEDQNKIFTKFFRSKNATSEEPTGSGLGLYIVRQIIQKHGGDIWFESIENKGTSFYIKLPLKN